MYQSRIENLVQQCIYLRTNSDLCHLYHKLIGFYNRDEKCLLRGTNWVFKQSSLRFVFKGLNLSETWRETQRWQSLGRSIRSALIGRAE